MVDTGAAVSVVSTAWAEAHGLKITQGKKINIRGAGGATIPTAGSTSFTIQLTPTLEVDLANVVVAEGKSYQCLLGGDILGGKPGILGPATIYMPGLADAGSILWKQDKMGCIACELFLAPATTLNPTSVLPPSPPPSTNGLVPTTTLEAEGVQMESCMRKKLAGLAAERDA